MPNRPKLNADQKEAFRTIRGFLDSRADTLVLEGYAGTGKTFLMQWVGKWLNKKQNPFSFLASTGRAATVLRGKTGFVARTVHSELYHFKEVEGDYDDLPEDAAMDKFGQMTLKFNLRAPDEDKRLYIIDEASMLSSIINDDQSVLAFGSGILMTDFFKAVGKNKVIFVGDPCQLPPIGQGSSPALDMEWLAKQGRMAFKIALNKIERIDSNNDILILADAVRKQVYQTHWETYPKLAAKNMNNVRLHSSDRELFKSYLDKYKEVSVNGTIAIARTNIMVQHINRAIRRDLYGGLDLPLQINDVLLVVQNNYAVPLTNGDFVVVTAIGEPRYQANLHFVSIRLKALASDEEYEILLSQDVLYGKAINFNKDQQKALMVDFSRRMRKKKIKPNSEIYKKAMMTDPYLNCLRAKYGYAVTCHKAQGGEWDHVYLFLDKKMYGMKRPELFRWWYTAITRGRKQLNLTNEWWIS
ncbi:MAG TPA: DEAD/DEAH box helicase [Chitinophagaceae bacterium]|nr:DEAD/DEAH box helicase [Chitinophagaceae bacterium]